MLILSISALRHRDLRQHRLERKGYTNTGTMKQEQKLFWRKVISQHNDAGTPLMIRLDSDKKNRLQRRDKPIFLNNYASASESDKMMTISSIAIFSHWFFIKYFKNAFECHPLGQRSAASEPPWPIMSCAIPRRNAWPPRFSASATPLMLAYCLVLLVQVPLDKLKTRSPVVIERILWSKWTAHSSTPEDAQQQKRSREEGLAMFFLIKTIAALVLESITWECSPKYHPVYTKALNASYTK